jgi:hypothetical protein
MDSKEASYQRATGSAIEIGKVVLDLVAPGTGLAFLLLEHVGGAYAERKRRCVETFGRAVLAAAASDDEINEQLLRHSADKSFQELLALLLRDIEDEKSTVYAAAYLHIVGDRVPQSIVEDFIHAVGALRLVDLRNAAAIVANEQLPGRDQKHGRAVADAFGAPSTRRLEHTGALDPQEGTRPPRLTELGRLMVQLLPL